MFGYRRDKYFALKDIEKGHHNVSYKGISAIKCPFDYILYQMIIFEVKPELIIEIGTNKGGSTLYLADLLEINRKGHIHTIDVPSNKEDELLHKHPRISVFKSGFINYDIKSLKEYAPIIVIEDGSHIYEDSLTALQLFAPYVTKNSYYIVEDGIVNELGREKEFNGGPQKAIRNFLKKNSNFIIDRKWCDFFGHNATFNINGYLKRVT